MVNFQSIAIAIAGISTAWACFASWRLIDDHRKNWKNPQTQQLIVYIILMVPLFAVDSFIGLLDMDASETMVMVLDSIKECYEAFVLKSFLELMYAYLHVSVGSIPDGLKGKELHQTFPFNYFLKDYKLDAVTVKTLYQWTLQFIILRPILSVVSVGLQLTDQFDNYSTYINIALNISVTIAVYALMMFYHAFAHELSPHRPLAQFLCIKGVVAFAFWQGVILSLLVKFGVVHGSHWYTTEEIDEGIQNFLVCVEMGAIFSFAHDYAFSAAEYKPGYVAPVVGPAPEHGKHH